MLRVFRGVLALAGAVCAVLLVRPFLLDGEARSSAASSGAAALLGLIAVAVAYLAPFAIGVDAALKADGDVLVCDTVRGRREVDLTRVQRVWSRRFPGRTRSEGVTVVGLTGPSVRLWVLLGRGHGKRQKRLRARVLPLIESGQARATPRAAHALRLDGAPSAAGRWVLAARGVAVYLMGFVAVAMVVGGYLSAAG